MFSYRDRWPLIKHSLPSWIINNISLILCMNGASALLKRFKIYSQTLLTYNVYCPTINQYKYLLML